MRKIFRHWKIIYLAGSLIFMAWIIHVGGNEFDRINSQFGMLVRQLEPERIRQAAIEELTAACLKKTHGGADPDRVNCHSWPDTVTAAKAEEIRERRRRAMERGLVKVVLFYTGFSVIFLLGPPIIVYLLLVGAIRIYRTVKFVRN